VSFLSVVQGGVAIASGIFGASNPKDKERFASADQLAARAAAGDQAALAQLRCLSGVGSAYEDQILRAANTPGYTPGSCVGGGWATEAARTYGKAKLAEVTARTTGSEVLTAAGVGALKAGAALSPAGPTAALRATLEEIPTPVKLAGAALLLFVVYKVLK